MSENFNQVQHKEIEEDSDGQRIDNFLIKTLKGVPKSKIYKCLRKGEVRLNGGRVQASTKVKIGDVIRIPPIRVSEGTIYKASNAFLSGLDKSIIYEDAGLIVVNKKPGLAVHGGSGLNLGLIEGMRQLRPQEKSLELVHRLDRDTSGCLMIAKKRRTLKALQAMLSDKKDLEKHYKAIVYGRWPKRRQHVNVPIRKDKLKSGEHICVVAADGKPSLTLFDVLKQDKNLSLLAVRPITGRTHQIRVHAKHIGYSIVGDPKYGHTDKDQAMQSRGFSRMMLHAARLVIPPLQPGDKTIVIEADAGAPFQKLANEIG